MGVISYDIGDADPFVVIDKIEELQSLITESMPESERYSHCIRT